MAPQNGGGSSGEDDAEKYKNATNVKYLFDLIGETVQKKVHGDAQQYFNELHGDLTKAKFEEAPNGQQTPAGPCGLNYEYHTNVTTGFSKEYPCRKDVNRFSDKEGAQCDNIKIKGNKGKEDNSGGACAPYRRLHLCDYNLENINRYDKINNDTLLADVCLAALHEGQSISLYHPGYHTDSSGSTMCTVLARSFADIGDIIRGKDLYLGDNGKDKLEENLQKIFAKIHEKLDSKAQTRYKGDTKNYYQLREDWWTANRATIWEAMTCEANGTYFRATCDSGDNEKHSTLASNKCRCDKDKGANADQVPTYFDYVPQYLRWFEEWAEDFCRKKKKYVDMVKTNCGGKDGKERYCDRDGFDCTKTIRAIFKYARGENCDNCIVWCGFYENWIENQKQEFLKQKKKYETEIPVNGRKRRSSPSTEDYEGYEKYFHEEFQRYNKDSKNFLGLLSKETECKELENDNENKVDFTNTDDDKESNEYKGTFYHSKYCQHCPICGVKKESDGQFVNIGEDEDECKEGKEEYNIPSGVSETKINVLYSGKGRGDITEKLKDFCETKVTKYKQDEEWECYYKDHNDNKCKMENNVAHDQEHSKIMSFNDFFHFWVGRVLTDAQGWRTQLTKCLSEDKLKKCEKGCKRNCECFKKWIEKKEQEWIKVKQQFNKQTDIPEGWGHYKLLENILEDYYFKNIQKAYGDLKSIQEMKKMIKENQNNPNRSKDDVDALDVLFDHELEEAEDCLDIHEDDDECVEESEKIPNNPCSGTRHRAMVKNVAADMHLEARQQLRNRAGGRKTLRADASQGKYRKKVTPSDLKGDKICNINTSYSNDSRGNNGEPCKGKDGRQVRFKIGTPWTNIVEKKTTSYKDVFLPPRREHMCTSNLENLDVGDVTNNGNVNDTFLGNVLLAANYEAKKIKEKYRDPNGQNKNKGICRAVRYSFADLGDIIKGTDMWDNDNGEKKTQENLVKIFDSIKKELVNKYKGDTKLAELRSDWWTANRRQVWKAMKCEIKKDSKIPCSGIPIEDYIPQRLRWMTEWAEWFCNEQSRLYEELLKKCGGCMGKGQGDGEGCTQKTQECDECKKACDKYKEEINKWRKQWDAISYKYLMLYWPAKTTAGHGGTRRYVGDVEPKDKPVVQFLEELEKVIKRTAPKRSKRDIKILNPSSTPTTPYETAEGYIHQEIGNAGCNVQTQFCKNKNGSDVSRTDTDNDYAFRDKPYDHDKACACNERDKIQPPKEKKKEACEIVEKILTKDNTALKDACDLKYNKGKNYGWKCVSSGDTTSDKGAICVPPRRRRLYVGKLGQWATKAESPPEGASPSNPRDGLRDAFIESAAVETFFLWDRYKKEWEHRNKKDTLGSVPSLNSYSLFRDISTQEDKPEDKLKKGEIPEEFKRQMFYTLGDYRDILVGNTDIVVEALSSSEKEKMNKIQQKIKDIVEKLNGDTPGQQPSDKRTALWGDFAQYIWNGMVCALTYTENTSGSNTEGGDGKTTTITQDTDLKEQLLENGKSTPKPQYQYKTVELKEEVNGAKPTKPPASGEKTTLLTDFISRPPYFRYLEEWGETFCRQRTRMLDKIIFECRNSERGGHHYCSGDGYDCTRDDIERNDNFVQLDCKDCHIQCRKYRKWIDIKFEEFHNQKNKYEEEHGKVVTSSTNGGADNKKFCEELQNRSTVQQFLEALKHCKPSEDNNDQDNKINFDKPEKTFNPSTYCKACPVYGVQKNRGTYSAINESKYMSKNSISGENKNDKKPTEIKVLLLGLKGEVRNNDEELKELKELKEVCNNAGFVEDYSLQKWNCQKKNGVDQCNLTNHVDATYFDKDIVFNEFFQRWIKDFLEGYYISKKKIEQCTKNGKNKCECIGKWVDQKTTEWNQIKNHFNRRPHDNGNDIKSKVKFFFQQEPFESDLKKAIGSSQKLEEYENSKECNGTENSGNGKPEKKDIVECLLENLGKKAKNCPGKPIDNQTEEQCTTPPSNLDDDDTPEDNESPEFCLEIPKPELPKKKEPCEIVEKILEGKDKKSNIEDCKHKYDPSEESYPKWDCHNYIDTKYNGACMPPRRQKLCLYYLKELNFQTQTKEEELRKGFVKSAALETFFAWNKYKKDKKKEQKTGVYPGDLDNELKSGTIPDEFKRIMFYTYGDYRDICLDSDISKKEGDVKKAKDKIDEIFPTTNTENKTKRQEWWDTNGPKIWEGMLCALEKISGKDNIKSNTKYSYSTVTFTQPSGVTLPTFAQTPQFLRWFIEWSEDFCKKRKEQLKKLEEGCRKYNCGDEQENKKGDCKRACEAYKSWLKDWKDQYEQQTAKFDKDKKEKKFDDTPAEFDVDVSSVHEYLQEQLEKFCKNSDCACMKNPSTQDEETELLGENYFPEAMDYPPKEIGKRCKCAIPPEPMSCVEQIAKHLREKAEKNVKNYENSLKGKPGNFNNNCNQIDEAIKGDNGSRTINKNKLNTTFPSNGESCENVGTDRLKIGQEWKCDKINNTEENICFPPRRQHICLKKLENMKNSVIDNNEKLLKAVMEAAQYEAIDILKKMKPEKEIKFCEICDAMKYSFADIGDIIRGKSKINTKNDKIEEELQKIFKKIQDDNKLSLSKMELPELREKWWDANRKDVWNAMTCVAPNDAHLKKRIKNPGDNSQTIDPITATQEKCGYDKEPPDYDYIPERYRFLQEWSEYYCKARNKMQDEMKNECPECLKKGTKCEKEEDKKKCKECNDKCKEYKNIVDKWKAQFEEQNEIYKKLYTQDRSYGPSTARRNPSIKFTQKLEDSCKNPDSAEKYLDISTHCTDYKFSEMNNNENYYAFSKYPTEYEKACKCNETPLPTQSGNNLISFIKKSIDFPHVPGLTKVTKIAPQIPRTIKNIMPDAHTIHAIVAKSFPYFVPLFQEDDKTPPTHNILNDVLPSAIPVGIALALTSIAFLYLK
ncbi:hypothetical protein C923_04151, partial [Plasmodium falciparum UGT5.1]